MKSWKTTVAGLLAGGALVAKALFAAYTAGTFNGESGFALVIGIGVVALGALAKDHNVSGGSTQQ